MHVISTNRKFVWLGVLFLLVGTLGWLSSCGSGCESSDPAALVIRVIGGGSTETSEGEGGSGGALPPGTPIPCRANVSVAPGPDNMSCSSRSEDCRCYVHGAAQAYIISVGLDGQTEEQRVEVKMRGCLVDTEEVCFFGECPE